MKNVKNLVVLVLLGGVIGGCGKDSPTPSGTNNTNSSGNCRVKTKQIILPSFKDTTYTIYEYNTAGKLSKESYYVKGDVYNYQFYDYSMNGIVDEKSISTNGTLICHTIYKLDSSGYVSSRTDSLTSGYRFYLYECNSAGYMIKFTDMGNGQIISYTITNGNLTQETEKTSSGKILYTTTYEYTDIPDKLDNQYSFFGKKNVNFVAKETTIGTSTAVTTYSYTFYNNGYSTEEIETNSNGSAPFIIKTKYTYTCP